MTKIYSSVIIHRPVEEVFSFVSHFENDVKWWTNVTESRVISDVKEGVGTTYHQVACFMGKGFESILRITESQPPTRVVLQSVKSAIPFVACFTFEDLKEKTRFTMDAKVTSGGFYKIVQPLFVFLMQRSTNQYFINLKKLLEEN